VQVNLCDQLAGDVACQTAQR